MMPLEVFALALTLPHLPSNKLRLACPYHDFTKACPAGAGPLPRRFMLDEKHVSNLGALLLFFIFIDLRTRQTMTTSFAERDPCQ